MTTHELHTDASVPLPAQPASGHNRWHPAITRGAS